MDLFIELLQTSLGSRVALSSIPTAEEWTQMFDLSRSQGVIGITLGGIGRLPKEQRPPKPVMKQWVGSSFGVQRRNEEMDTAVVKLCHDAEVIGLRILVFKGQTLNALYDERYIKDGWEFDIQKLRQSGDIDFYVRKEDWSKAIDALESMVVKGYVSHYRDKTTEKDVQFEYRGITYEMHRMMVSLASPKHRYYWEHVVMPEVLDHHYSVTINGYDVPTLAPVYNILYVFVHIFEHLILDGIGYRQFCDLFVLLKTYTLTSEEVKRLEVHLNKLGLKKAFTVFEAFLTDYLGMNEDKCPLAISVVDHKRATTLEYNVLKMGNFGHNKQYSIKRGFGHGVLHVFRAASQIKHFWYYAPSEALWRIPYMISWRIKRMWMM